MSNTSVLVKKMERQRLLTCSFSKHVSVSFQVPCRHSQLWQQLSLPCSPPCCCPENKTLLWATRPILLFFSLPPLFCSLQFLISDRDRDPQCNLHCSRSQSKPLCASDGRTYESMCDYQRAKCREQSLSVAHRGRCKGRSTSGTSWGALGLLPHELGS